MPTLFTTRTFLLLLTLCSAAAAQDEVEAPRVLALLAQADAAERGIGLRRSDRLAIDLYCDAGSLGSAEAYFRIGRILAQRSYPKPGLANAHLALAARLGHHGALDLYDANGGRADDDAICTDVDEDEGVPEFDVESYIDALIPAKQRIAALIRKHAARYGVDIRFALAVALAESNLEASAVSPKNAQGVMQLIPETSARFGVKNAFNAEQNIRGGLAYLKWLDARFNGNRRLVAAAYNAGEGVVERYGDVPPYPETRDYVRRVLRFSGLAPMK